MKLLAALLVSLALSAAPERAKPRVLVASYSGIVSPAFSEYVLAAHARAEAERFDAFALLLDTPGGLDSSMRVVVKAFLASRVPVIVYVHPPGGRAASAGVFLTMAAHVAAMSPGTNIGAAHPVQLGAPAGRERDAKPDPVMERKMTSDASAYLQAIAARRGRNASWAEFVVAKSSSIPSAEAVRLKIVDIEADSLAALLDAVDGRALADFKEPLRTRGAALTRVEMTPRQKLLAKVSDPNIAMLLMTLGMTGLLIELYNPGLILPGVVGAVSLILAFYSFETLSANYAGLILIALGALFLLLELKITSFGLLGLAGISAILFGSMMSFRDASGAFTIAWSTIALSAAVLLALLGVLLFIVKQALGGGPRVGAEAMIGARGTVVEALSPHGTVKLGDELWRAVAASGEIPAGAEVEIVSVDKLTVTVRRAP